MDNVQATAVRNRNVALTSDNIAGAAPEVIRAIAESSAGNAQSYGADTYTRRVERRFADIFEHDLSMLLVTTGSAANALALATLTPPWGSVLCHPESHINVDECGAPEFYTAGAKLVTVDGADAKLDPRQLTRAARRDVGDVHAVQPSSVSITQATETGSVYQRHEVEQIGAICREASLRFHMDGARFANALAAIDATPAEMTWKAGVDALSFGATKNGTLAAEAILLFDRSLTTEMGYRRKRGGHLVSKMRLLAAQMEAYLADDLWLRNARHANAMAHRLDAGLRAIDGVAIQGATEANILFCTLPQRVIDALLAAGCHFYHDRWGPGVIRLVTSFTTQAEDIDAFVDAVREQMG